MAELSSLARGGQAEQAWSKPPRSRAERREHVLRKLSADNKLWIATASPDGSAHLVPFSYVCDVVLIDGDATVVSPRDVESATADRLAQVSAIDGRRAPGFAYLQVVPRRVQAWWSGAELATPTIMREGRWVD